MRRCANASGTRWKQGVTGAPPAMTPLKFFRLVSTMRIRIFLLEIRPFQSGRRTYNRVKTGGFLGDSHQLMSVPAMLKLKSVIFQLQLTFNIILYWFQMNSIVIRHLHDFMK